MNFDPLQKPEAFLVGESSLPFSTRSSFKEECAIHPYTSSSQILSHEQTGETANTDKNGLFQE